MTALTARRWIIERVPAADRRLAASILGDVEPLRLRRGAWLTGDDCAGMAIVIVSAGLLAVATATRGASRRLVLDLAGRDCMVPGPLHGEALLAVADCWLVPIDDERLAELLAVPGAAEPLAHGLADAVCRSREMTAVFGHVSHVERVRLKLSQLARSHGRVRPEGIVLDIPLTHELLGWMVGSARETVTAALGELAREGIVSREGRRYRLNLPPQAL